jgi:predicted ATP-dependent endonuclease of OLD family
MLIEFVEIRNFRKLESCRIDISKKETVFVGANNSGKTSAMDALILFLKRRTDFSTRDFTLSHWKHLNAIGEKWINRKEEEPLELTVSEWELWLPHVDIWLNVEAKEIHYVADLIPTLDWQSGLLGVRLRLEPKNLEELYKDFKTTYQASRQISKDIQLWPENMWDFLEKKLGTYFSVGYYLLDKAKLTEVVDGMAYPQELPAESAAIAGEPFKNLIKVDIINAQRGFSDTNDGKESKVPVTGNLTSQMKAYYTSHLDPYDQPEMADLDALKAIDGARVSFDERLKTSFAPSLKELEKLNYPGFGGNPLITISSRINALDGMNHGSAVQFSVLNTENVDGKRPLTLPERSNGLGYQNLISMVFKLIAFRDEWMRMGKKSKENVAGGDEGFEPIHLVLVEEPEAHLHAQVQQVFIRKAHEILIENELLKQHQLFKTQLIVSTHSNHIAHEIEFTSLRYFKRIAAKTGSIPTSTVVSLSDVFENPDATMRFASRYLKTTHCDLFFADAVILVEGAAERMLMPHFIRYQFEKLSSCYISILEIGGSHAFRLRSLIEKLGITTLIITDIDSINPADHRRSALPEKGKGYKTGNSTLSKWLPAIDSLDVLMVLEPEQKISKELLVRVAYQYPVDLQLSDDKAAVPVTPYTFEVAMVQNNIPFFKELKDGTGLIKKMHEAASKTTAIDANKHMFEAVESGGKAGNKAEFALELLYYEDPKLLQVPDYIADGLRWLEEKLNGPEIKIINKKNPEA